MNKLKAFVKLDFVTVKPYFTIKNLLIYMVIAVYMAIMSKNISSAIGIGMMLATMFVSYPFALAEKSNMDALYITLGVNRKTVVKGRYVFTLLLNLCVVVFMFSLSAITSVLTNSLVNGADIAEALGATLVLSAIFLIVQATQLPLFFKMPYSKAKFISLAPFLLIMAFVAYFIMNAQGSGMPEATNDFVWAIAGNAWAFGAMVVAILAIVVFVSYKLSLMFYKKREF